MRIVLAVLAGLVFLSSYAVAGNLHESFKDDQDITVYLKDVTTSAVSKDVNIEEFKKIFTETHSKRINMKFTPVDNEKDADVIVSADIKRYEFTPRAMPRFYSAYALVADTTAPKSTGKIVVDYKVIVPKEGNRVVNFKAFTTEESRPIEDMKGANGFILTAGENIDRFIYRTYYKVKEKK